MSIFSAIGSFVAGPFGALAGTAVSALLGAKAASDQRKQMISDQDNQFVRMRNAATKAGFNPLTVMRNGGAQMFGGVPTFSKAGFMQQFVQQGYNAWTTHPDNDPLKKYNDEVRKLTLEDMKTNIKLGKAQINDLLKNKGTDFVGPKTVPLFEKDGTQVTDKNGNAIFVPAESNEAIPKYKMVWDQASGALYAIINPELTESGPGETATGLAIDAAGQEVAKSGKGMTFRGWGFSPDPFGLNRGVRSVNGNNMINARPKLSF